MKAIITKTQKKHDSLWVTYRGEHPEFGCVTKELFFQATADTVRPDNDEWGPKVDSLITGYSVKADIPEWLTIPETGQELITGSWRPAKSNLPEYRQNPITLTEEAKQFFSR